MQATSSDIASAYFIRQNKKQFLSAKGSLIDMEE